MQTSNWIFIRSLETFILGATSRNNFQLKRIYFVANFVDPTLAGNLSLLKNQFVAIWGEEERTCEIFGTMGWTSYLLIISWFERFQILWSLESWFDRSLEDLIQWTWTLLDWSSNLNQMTTKSLQSLKLYFFMQLFSLGLTWSKEKLFRSAIWNLFFLPFSIYSLLPSFLFFS